MTLLALCAAATVIAACASPGDDTIANTSSDTAALHASMTPVRYEAELATTNLPTEMRWPGWSGASYLCCWSSQGQFVTFNVNAPTAGTYTLAFGYSAGSGVASRQLKVNGSVLAANQQFPATASWSTWVTVGVSAALNAGANTVTLTFDSPSGSANFINIDYLDVSGGGSGSGPHTYNDTDPSITYSLGGNDPGNGQIWNHFAGSSPEDIDDDEHSVNVYSSSFTVNFSGTDFQWIGKKGPNYGIASIWLDGHAQSSIDNYHATELDQQVLYAVSGLSNGSHVFRMSLGGYPNPAKNPASSDTWQTLDAFTTSGTPLTLAGVPASGGSVSRTGTWTCGFNNNTDLSASHCWSNTSGSTMSISFTGTGIEVYDRPDGENGMTDVYIDGVRQFTYDGFGLPYDSSCDDCVNGQNSITVAGLAHGAHTLKLVVLHSKNTAATDYYTQIDEFMVMP